MAPRQPPDHLSPAMRDWWRHVMSTYMLEPHHVHLLQLACESFDEAQRARAILATEGMTVPSSSGGIRSHPAVAIERDSRLAFARLVRELDLDTEPPVPARIGPPSLFLQSRIAAARDGGELMPVKARQPKRRRVVLLPFAARRWLLTGGRSVWYYSTICGSGGKITGPDFWNEHRDAVVAHWARRHPGTRPPLWWRYSAPQPRRRLSGIGTPLHECSAYGFVLDLGIPEHWRGRSDSWLTADPMKYPPIDPADPPIYESQAGYLERLALLLPGERGRLASRDFRAEAIT